MTCDRCGKTTNVHTMSMFNTEEICLECKEAERQRPDYQAARAACAAGNCDGPSWQRFGYEAPSPQPQPTVREVQEEWTAAFKRYELRFTKVCERSQDAEKRVGELEEALHQRDQALKIIRMALGLPETHPDGTDILPRIQSLLADQPKVTAELNIGSRQRNNAAPPLKKEPSGTGKIG